MELLHKIVLDFAMFSLLESWVFCKSYYYYGNCSKFSFIEIFVIGIINCVISQVIPPILYQFVMIVWMGCYLYLFKNKTILVGLYLSFSSMIFLMIIEGIFMIIYVNIFNIDISSLNSIGIFISCIPMKLFEVIIIKGGSYMKAWWATIEKRK